ncbi:serine/threonine-protein kinase [Nocardioides pacificus]
MPSSLGRYAVRRRIGAGGFATVWLAYDEQLDSPVAVKVLADNWTEDHHVRGRFLEEGRFLRRVESPHVVTVYDAGELADGRPYLVMTYADQGTLADRVERGPVPVSEALEIVTQVGRGLQALHARDVLHRDVKPANVLFRTVEGSGSAARAMVGDLGLGKALDMSSRLTMIAGSPSYVAPEQAVGERLDARADLYSLAAITYLLLAGRAPYSHTTLSAAAAPTAPPPLHELTDLPPAVDAVVRRGLAVDREERWPDIGAYLVALEEALSGVPGRVVAHTDPEATERIIAADPELTRPGARPSSSSGPATAAPEPPPTRRRRTAVALTLAALLVPAAVGGTVGYLGGSGREPEQTVTDEQGDLSVTVPGSWHRAQAVDGWVPPQQSERFPALSVGTSVTWADPESGGQGVFVGLLPGDDLPSMLPQHEECAAASEPVSDQSDGDEALTVFHTGCPSGVTVERVVQVTGSQLLWVQVRSQDRATANRVLDAVRTHGM